MAAGHDHRRAPGSGPVRDGMVPGYHGVHARQADPLDPMAQQSIHRPGSGTRRGGPARRAARCEDPRRATARSWPDPGRDHPKPRRQNLGRHCRRDPSRDRHERRPRANPPRSGTQRAARSGVEDQTDRRDAVHGPHRPRRRRRTEPMDQAAPATRQPRLIPAGQRRPATGPDLGVGAHRSLHHHRGPRIPHQAGRPRMRRRARGPRPRALRAYGRGRCPVARRHGDDPGHLAHLTATGVGLPHRLRPRRPRRHRRRPRPPPKGSGRQRRRAVGHGRAVRRRPARPALQPRRLELGQLHHHPARQRRGDGCSGAGADPERGGRAPQLPRRLPDPATNHRGPADREQRMGRRSRGGAAPQSQDQTTRPQPKRDRQSPRGRRQARPRQRPDPPVRGVHRHRAQDRPDRRARPPPRRRRAPRRVRPAPARPGPRHRRRSVHRPPRRQPDPPGSLMTGRTPRPQAKANAQHRGRDVARLLADFGHDLPAAPPAAIEPKEAPLFQYAHRGGCRRRGRGWTPAKAPVSTWRMTSDQAPVLWPFIATPGLPPTGAQIGIDMLSGGSFYADPFGWVLHDTVPVTNPNMFIFGKPGRGKSATVKALLLRMMDFGYRALILGDPKDEYERLSRAFGVEPFAIGPGLPARINPLAFGPLGVGWDRLSAAEARSRAAIVFGRWLTLVRGLVGSQRLGDRRVPFGPTDEVVIKTALQDLTGYAGGHTRLREVTVPQLWQLLDNPTPDLIAACRYQSARHFLDETRLLRDALGQLVSGALAGLFDGPTTIQVDWLAPIQSLSLSRLEPLGDEAVGIALLCLNSWGRGMREVADRGDVRIVVRDESWKQLRLGVEAVKSFDGDMRLSRSTGDIQIAVGHKPSDPLSAGDASSQAVAIAKDLLHLADIKVLHGQDFAVALELDGLLGLGPIAQHLVTGWAMQGKGRALWCVGDQLYKVQTVLHPTEHALTYTNDAIQTAA